MIFSLHSFSSTICLALITASFSSSGKGKKIVPRPPPVPDSHCARPPSDQVVFQNLQEMIEARCNALMIISL
ncbi:hypothetical protein ACFX1W_033175 [Malus domestica]